MVKFKFEIRDYQKQACKVLHTDLQTQKEVLLQAIMSAGKTVISARLINYYYHRTNRKFLILAHKGFLVEQFRDTIRDKTDIQYSDVGVCCSELNQNQIRKRITIATIQSFVKFLDKYQGCELLIVDEAHRINMNPNSNSDKDSQYKQAIDVLRTKNPEMRILGITATPFRLGHGYTYGDKCKGINLFPKLNHRITYDELKSLGYVMPLEGKIAINSEYAADMKDIPTGINGDFQEHRLDDVMTKQIHLQTAVDAIHQYCSEFKFIALIACSINHAKKLYELLESEAVIIHSEQRKLENSLAMQTWKSGKKRIMISVLKLIEGFDFPALDCIVTAQETLSPARYLQTIGRVLRISPETGKTKAFVLDLTGNTNRFGTDLDNVKVTIPKEVEEKEKEEQKFLKQCPECKAEVHCARYECDCGYLFPMLEKPIAEEIPEMKDVRFNEPVEHHVSRVEIKRHSKEGKPDSIKISYHNDNPFRSYIASDYLCLWHGGRAAAYGRQKWLKLTTDKPEDIPATIEEAIDQLPYKLIKPEKILTKKNGDYTNIVDYLYDTVPF